MHSEFGIVAPGEWQLGPNINDERKRSLENTSFETIVNRICEQADLGPCEWEVVRAIPGANRAKISLVLPCGTVDLFHNGAGGYRAQFYIGVENAIGANRFLVNRIMDQLKCLWPAAPNESCSWQFIEASLTHHDAKVWIREGAWLDDNKSSDRNLTVDFWQKNRCKAHLGYRFEPSWAELTPCRETIIEVKGGCIDASLQIIDKKLKPQFFEEVQQHGYS